MILNMPFPGHPRSMLMSQFDIIIGLLTSVQPYVKSDALRDTDLQNLSDFEFDLQYHASSNLMGELNGPYMTSCQYLIAMRALALLAG